MAMPAWMHEAWNELSSDNQKKAEMIIQIILTQLGEDRAEQTDINATSAAVNSDRVDEYAPLAEQKPVKKKRQLGIMSERFISISDDFDEPLEDFREYM